MPKWSCVLVVLVLVAVTAAWAQTTDPATLFFGPGANTGLTCTSGPKIGQDAALGCGLDPNPVPANHFDIFNNQGGQQDIDTFFLIVGVPNVTSAFPLPSIDSVTTYNPYVPPVQQVNDGTNGTNVASSFCGTMIQNDAFDAYNRCGYNGTTNASNNWTNWSGVESTIGITATSFALFQYNLTPQIDLGPKGLYDILMTSGLPTGSILIAYGCAAGDTLVAGTVSTGGTTLNIQHCSGGGGNTYSTPFTEAGFVPEPASIVLLGTVLVAVGGLWRRKHAALS